MGPVGGQDSQRAGCSRHPAGLGSLYADKGKKTRLLRFIYEGLQKLACRTSDLTIFQNHDDARQFIAAGVVSENKVKIIFGSGVDTGRFSASQVTRQQRNEVRQALGLRPDETVVTMISRVIRSKGVLEFMTAAQRVSSQCPNTRFLLIGSDDPHSLDRLDDAELHRLKQAVTWPGPRQDIPAVLAVSDIFVLPSAYREGIPRVLLEAASMGLPLITTDSPGCNEVVEDGANGCLVPVTNPEALSRAIVNLVEQSQLREQFGRVSRRRVVERFDLSVVAEQTRSIYLELLKRKGLMPRRLKSNERTTSDNGSLQSPAKKANCQLLYL